MATVNSEIGTLDLTVPHGAQWELTIEIEDEDGDPIAFSTPVSALCQVRADWGASSGVLLTLAVDVTGAATGEFVLSLTASQTASLDLSAFDDTQEVIAYGKWDLLLTESGESDGVYWVQGAFSIDRRISR